jgi:hypothetical protein
MDRIELPYIEYSFFYHLNILVLEMIEYSFIVEAGRNSFKTRENFLGNYRITSFPSPTNV